MKKKLFSICFILICVFSLNAQSFFSEEPTATDRHLSEEEFRNGVQAWYRGYYNESILQFEKALSYLPEEALILDWLGRAYYKAGLEGTALEQWRIASDLGYGGSLLKNKIEIIENRRITGSDVESNIRYVETGTFPGSNGDTLFFSQPISVLPNKDGTVWVLAYGSNELLLFDINGTIINRIRGPINGFDRPMDIIQQSSGNLLVTEYLGDRIAQLDSTGNFITYIGEKGRADGQLLGPQYIAQDSSENIYVTDYGNARVVVFDKTGKWLFNFGNLKSPTGITIIDDIVYIADNIIGNISMYDTNGNYLDDLVEENSFKNIESLRHYGEDIIASDSNKVYFISLDRGQIREFINVGNAPTQFTTADVDVNGNILATDFFNDDVVVLSSMSDLVGGLFVQIEKVYAEEFPHVTVELRVQDRNYNPVVGLKDINFLITEEQRPVSQQKLIGAADENDVCDITILIDRNFSTQDYSTAIDSVVQEIAKNMPDSAILRIVTASNTPLTEYKGNPSVMDTFSSANIRNPLTSIPSTDLAIRLAANDLVTAQPKRAIVYVTTGDSQPNAFDNYALTDISSYLNNNGISFFVVNLTNQNLSSDIDYIVKHTPGEEYFVFRPQGLTSLVQDIIDVPLGLYQFSYVSSLPTDFGKLFLPVESEVYLMNSSGRDETGYFTPYQ